MAALIIAVIVSDGGCPRSSSLAASMTGSAVSSSCTPLQKGVPSGKKFCAQCPSGDCRVAR